MSRLIVDVRHGCDCGRTFRTLRGLTQHQSRIRHLCRRCGGEQTAVDREAGFCTQCHQRLR